MPNIATDMGGFAGPGFPLMTNPGTTVTTFSGPINFGPLIAQSGVQNINGMFGQALPSITFDPAPTLSNGMGFGYVDGSHVGFFRLGTASVGLSNLGVTLVSSGLITWSSSSSNVAGTVDTVVVRDAAMVMALRINGPSATAAWRAYNTFTDASNYEYGSFGWASNVLTLTSVALGTGTNRNIAIIPAGGVTTHTGDFKLGTAGNGLYVKEGTNATMGRGTLVGGTLVVNTTKVTTNSEIFISDAGGGGANIGAMYENRAARVVGTSFTVNSANALDTSNFCWLIVEPA